MTGGIFTSQNKVRPGAYINFKAVPKPSGTVGTRGIVALPVVLGWGMENTAVDVYSTDLADGTCLNKFGYVGTEEEMQIIREALKNAYKAIVYRLDTGGTKATVTVGELTAIAKYPGVVGNRISIVIKELAEGSYEVLTLLDNQVKVKQTAATIDGLVSNDWLDFTGVGELTASAGITLTGGTNGTVAEANYTSFLNAVKAKTWNTMACPSMRLSGKSGNFNQNVVAYIKSLRDAGKKVQAVVNGYPDANHEGIISVDQGYKTINEIVTMDSFVGYVAGMTSGASVNQSNTYKVIDGAIEIINPKTDEEIETGLTDGQMLLSYRSDGAVVIESDINTLCEFTTDKNKDFRKNRVIRTLDDINNTIKQTFENMFIGKVDNGDNGRNLLKSTILSYLDGMAKMGAIESVEADDIKVLAGSEIDSVVVELAVQPIDAMEKLYMTVNVGGK